MKGLDFLKTVWCDNARKVLVICHLLQAAIYHFNDWPLISTFCNVRKLMIEQYS